MHRSSLMISSFGKTKIAACAAAAIMSAAMLGSLPTAAAPSVLLRAKSGAGQAAALPLPTGERRPFQQAKFGTCGPAICTIVLTNVGPNKLLEIQAITCSNLFSNTSTNRVFVLRPTEELTTVPVAVIPVVQE